MIPCISQATTLSATFDADVSAYARAGWKHVELWLTKLETFLETHSLADAKSVLDSEGLEPVAAAAQGGLLLSRGLEREAHWDHYRRRLALLQGLGVSRLVVAADFVREPMPDDYPRAVDSLREAAEAAQQHGVVLALEFQKGAKFCASLDTTIALITQCSAAGLGVCLDLFHYYTGPSKFEDLAYLSAQNLAWVQVCDLSGTPREVATDGDRILPGEGDFQIAPILDHLGRAGYDGFVSLELLNPQLWKVPADRVADAAFQAICRTLGRWRQAEPWGGP